ncbi:MAG: pyrroline-5-carboxylate reductase [Alphaproteobacteria bacterium]|nr:pyrroline-5-carboxylate reductase [Alphaproteobacteria bacterium]
MTAGSINVLLVGCGKMGGALLQRWQAQNLCKSVHVVEPHPQGLSVPEVTDVAALPADFAPDVIVMAVKPQILPEVVGDYKAFTDKGCLLLSIAAGKPISFFEEYLGDSAAIVRVMPNTPAAIGQGITVATANKNASDRQKEDATALLSAVGEVLWVDDEEKLNPVTALSGSGPAYVFLLIEAMTQAGVHIGLEPDMAAKLARQTVIGSAALAKQSAEVPASTLRENVTSPGGTTAAALAVLMAEPGMQDLFNRALAAATKRAEELSK